MSVCNPCLSTKPIARCVTNLIIGTIEQLSTAIKVYITNVTTGRIIEYAVTSGADGKVKLPITPQQFSEDHSYTIHITSADSIGINETQTITIGELAAECLALRFHTIWKNDNTIATYTNQTLSLSE